ncbi:MAG: molybdopterin-dependent oxidoreductase [Microthrixaceae bacterium]|nr:molybdopterin-dependent oxidoreductase [Microthrixaceae bacterium]
MFTGKSHMPTPTKVLWYNNANLINQAKWAYDIVHNVNPKVDMIVDQQIEWTGSAEFADIVLPVSSWMELQTKEMGGSCSNPFLQIWQGGIEPLHDTRDDIAIFAGVADALTELTGEDRFSAYFQFSDRPEVYLDRVLRASFTTEGYTVDDIVKGRYGEPGGALMQYRTYPRIPFTEQVEDSLPFYTDTGRMSAYVDLPEAIEYGENLIVHREAVEATWYLPNVIVSSSPYLRPNDYGIPIDENDPDLRQVRNLMMPWSEVRKTENPLIAEGYRFLCLTPKSRHSTHSSWAVTDWHWIYNNNWGDPYRANNRMPGVGDPQMHINPDDARELDIADGDYVWVDANSVDRPYRGAKEDDDFYDVARLQVRVSYNPGYRGASRCSSTPSTWPHQGRTRRHAHARTAVPWPPTPDTRRASCPVASRASPAAGRRHCTRPTPCSTRRPVPWPSCSASMWTTTRSTPCPRRPSCASPRPPTAARAAPGSGGAASPA